MLKTSILLLSIALFSLECRAQPQATGSFGVDTADLLEFDPFAPDANQTLMEFDSAYENQTGLPSQLESPNDPYGIQRAMDCQQFTCKVYARVSKEEQKLYLYLDGKLTDTFLVSTGVPGRSTPNFDTHPSGRIYDEYTSSKYPGGDYKGLGNMPYAVFIKGGFAIHGTAESNWKDLGKRASHGCIRLHPDNAFLFNRLVRANGIENTWITVQDKP